MSRYQEELPLTQDVPRAPPPGPTSGPQGVGIAIEQRGLAVPRVWFLAEDEQRLVQVQHDRFCFNWRRLKAEEPYPEFVSVFRDFERHLQTFQAFASEAGWETRAEQCELTYINDVPADFLANLGQIGRLTPDVCWRETPDRVLPAPSALLWQVLFPLPDNDGGLTVTLTADGGPIIRLNLVARGPASEGWYARAHATIVSAFEELTTAEAHQAWGRREETS